MVALTRQLLQYTDGGNCREPRAPHEISRAEQDAYALRSQQEAKRAQDAGYLAEEIVPVEVKTRKDSFVFAVDDHARPETTIEGLAKLKSSIQQRRICYSG